MGNWSILQENTIAQCQYIYGLNTRKVDAVDFVMVMKNLTDKLQFVDSNGYDNIKNIFKRCQFWKLFDILNIVCWIHINNSEALV